MLRYIHTLTHPKAIASELFKTKEKLYTRKYLFNKFYNLRFNRDNSDRELQDKVKKTIYNKGGLGLLP